MKLSCILALLLICSVKGFPRYRREDAKAPCENKYEQCAEWKKASMCEQENNKDYMASICPVDCGYCRSTSESPGAAIQAQPAPVEPASSDVVQADPSQATESVGYTSKTNKDTASSETSSQDLQAASKSESNDDRPATNEQTQSSSKHFGKEIGNTKEKENKKQLKKTAVQGSGSPVAKEDKAPVVKGSDQDESSRDSGESGSGGAGYFENDEEIDDLVNLSDADDDDSNDADDDNNHNSESRKKPDTENAFNTEEQMVFGEPQKGTTRHSIESPEESGESGGEEESGNERVEIEKGNTNEQEQNTGKATEQKIKLQEQKEPKKQKSAEKYQDNSTEDNKTEGNPTEVKKSSQRSKKKASSHKNKKNSQKVKTVEISKITIENKQAGQRKNLLENLMKKGKLKAYSVAKTREKVPPATHHAEKTEEGDELNLGGTALDFLSGSGSGNDDDKLHLTLRQTFDTKYANSKTPAYQILSGNLEKDVEAALGEGNEVSDVTFSESQIEGNPRTLGKVRVNFRFLGNWSKLEKLVKSGSINGLLVVKDSLEGGGVFDK